MRKDAIAFPSLTKTVLDLSLCVLITAHARDFTTWQRHPLIGSLSSHLLPCLSVSLPPCLPATLPPASLPFYLPASLDQKYFNQVAPKNEAAAKELFCSPLGPRS